MTARLILFAATALAVAEPAIAADQAQRPVPPTEQQRAERYRVQADRWQRAYWVASAADAAVTIYALENGKGVEANPLWGKHPTPLTVIGAKVGFGVVQHLIYREVRKQDPKLALRVAQISFAVQSGVVLWNARVVF